MKFKLSQTSFPDVGTDRTSSTNTGFNSSLENSATKTIQYYVLMVLAGLLFISTSVFADLRQCKFRVYNCLSCGLTCSTLYDNDADIRVFHNNNNEPLKDKEIPAQTYGSAACNTATCDLRISLGKGGFEEYDNLCGDHSIVASGHSAGTKKTWELKSGKHCNVPKRGNVGKSCFC